MDPRFEQFIQERKYLLNVSPATLDWCKHSLKWLPMLRDVKLLCKATQHRPTGPHYSRLPSHLRGELFAESWQRVPRTEDARPFNA
jgi:hypothetical protein